MVIGELNEAVRKYWPQVDDALLPRAYEVAARAHEGQRRLSGDPYIVHPLEVGGILSEVEAHPSGVVAGLLHDTLEDTDLTEADIQAEFGDTVAGLVRGVTNLRRLNFRSRQEEQAGNLRKMFLAMARDMRVIIVKLADRLHNMRTLDPLPLERQHETAHETLDIYAPLAHRLGVWRFKWELEDLALKYLEPGEYWELADRVGMARQEREALIGRARAALHERLTDMGIEAQVQGRAKHFHSIYQKMHSQRLSFEEIGDLIGLRVLVNTKDDCYKVLGVVHDLWLPIPGLFTDYVAMPKSNKYQSLHTRVVGPDGQPIEVQIRSTEMHRTAEFGVAAHWRYKEGGKADRWDEQLGWFRQLLEVSSDLPDHHEFLEELRLDLFNDQVFVFTPQGEVKDLPAGAGPLDFAYRIHTEVGHRCVGAKVNGKLVPLAYEFKNGDIAEIITNPAAHPSPDWLRLIKASSIKSKVRRYLKLQMRDYNIAAGKEALQRAIRRRHLTERERIDLDVLAGLAEKMNFPDEEGLLAAIGYGEVEPDTVVSRLLAQWRPPETLEEEADLFRGTADAAAVEMPAAPVAIGGISGIASRLSKCCAPLPGDEVVGYITRGRGLTIHRADCKNLRHHARQEPSRVVPLTWDDGSAARTYPADLEVVAVDRLGLLAHISTIVSEMDTNIRAATVRTTPSHLANLQLSVDVRSREALEELINRLRGLVDVISVRRLGRAGAGSADGG